MSERTDLDRLEGILTGTGTVVEYMGPARGGRRWSVVLAPAAGASWAREDAGLRVRAFGATLAEAVEHAIDDLSAIVASRVLAAEPE